MLNEVENAVLWTYVVNDLNEEKLIGRFYKKELQKNKSTRL